MYLSIVSVEEVCFLSLYVVEPLDELYHSTLAAPTGTNEGQRLTNPHTQINIKQHLQDTHTQIQLEHQYVETNRLKTASQ